MASRYHVQSIPLRLCMVAGLAVLLLLCCDCASDLKVTIDAYTPPTDFDRHSVNDFRAGSQVTLTCQVEGAPGTVTYQWTSTCTGQCFVLRTPTFQSVTGTFLRAGVDDGTHTCTATDSDGGTGSASFLMMIITAPNPPENFVIIVMSSDTLQFSWDPPNIAIGRLNLYKLSCRSIFPPDLQRNSSKEYHLNDSNWAMSIMDTQSGFGPGVTYECSVLSSNTAGDGLPAVQIVTTHPKLPTGPPQSFEISGGPRTLTFSWTQIAPELRNGNITRYTITCDPTVPSVLPATTTGVSISLDGFTPYTDYNCQVVGRNSIGPSRPAPATIQTPEDVPTGPPQSFEISGGPRTLTFSWTQIAPELRNGNITSYTITCDPTVPSVLPATTTGVSISLDGFTPYTNYSCHVVGTNSIGDSPPAPASIQTLGNVLLIQLQVTGILDCTQWTLQDPHGKLQDILDELPQEIEKLCTCGFTSQQLTEGEFQCLSQPDEVTYRARLSGTTSRSSADIVADIEEWIASGEANIKVQGVRRSLDSTCLPVAVETFDAQECGMGDQTNTTSPSIDETSDTQSDNSVVAATAVSGVVAVLVVLIIVVALSLLFTVVLVLRHRRAELSIQRGEAVKGGEVATSSNPWITATECAAYGAPPSLPLQDLTESRDYEVITGRNDAYTPIQHSERDESVEYENTYEVVSNN